MSEIVFNQYVEPDLGMSFAPSDRESIIDCSYNGKLVATMKFGCKGKDCNCHVRQLAAGQSVTVLQFSSGDKPKISEALRTEIPDGSTVVESNYMQFVVTESAGRISSAQLCRKDKSVVASANCPQ